MDATDKLDMSLDDIIEQSKRQSSIKRSSLRGRGVRGGIRKPVSRGRGGGRSIGAGQTYLEPQLDARGKWKKDASMPRKRGTPRLQTRPRQTFRPVTIPQRQPEMPTYRPPSTDKLFLSNLEYRVSERDLLELFSQVGPLRSVRVNYDKSGRSLGTGEVTFQVPFHAQMAERRFNGILIDSKPLVIQKSGNASSGQNSGPTKLSSGITVIDPNEAATTVPYGESGSSKPTGAALGSNVGPRVRSSIMRGGMYSDRMDIG